MPHPKFFWRNDRANRLLQVAGLIGADVEIDWAPKRDTKQRRILRGRLVEVALSAQGGGTDFAVVRARQNDHFSEAINLGWIFHIDLSDDPKFVNP
ncbi:MAG: hypothetical protein ACF8PN_08065 [Phycisphaerales bacterium]